MKLLKLLSSTQLEKFKQIKLLVLDVDGVMTNGGLMISDDGKEYKIFHAHDGLGMKLLKSTGVELAIITGRKSQVVSQRAESTGVSHLFQGAEDKLAAWQQLLKDTGIRAENAAFVGDDVVDLPPMIDSGLAIAVPAAPEMVLQHADYVTQKAGGQGAVREVCELIMQAQGTFESTMQPFLTKANIAN